MKVREGWLLAFGASGVVSAGNLSTSSASAKKSSAQGWFVQLCLTSSGWGAGPPAFGFTWMGILIIALVVVAVWVGAIVVAVAALARTAGKADARADAEMRTLVSPEAPEPGVEGTPLDALEQEVMRTNARAGSPGHDPERPPADPPPPAAKRFRRRSPFGRGDRAPQP